SDTLTRKAELQWRISQVLMMILLAMLAVPLSKSAPRQGRYGKMALAILLYIAYTNLLMVAMNWIRKGVVSPEIGMWWVHALFLLLFIILFARQMGWLSGLKRKSHNVLHCPDEFDELVDDSS
ncbi:MAG TPA: LptF/LptG family permease, partial [Desulfobacterales bacterium]|nr:LptF/LptG family permease [Desulfobacterales bacterium]